MIYGIRSNGNCHGLVLTKPIVVKTMLDRIGYIPDFDLSKLRVIEPAAGAGAFASEIVDRLYLSSIKFGFSFQNALTNVKLFEIDKEMAGILYERMESLLKKYAASVPDNLIQEEDFLLSNTENFDLVIGNPPYVRHENIPEEKKIIYRKTFKTFRFRSDLYIAFYEKGLRILKDDGILSFICSNRWLKNQYGQALRNLIQIRYSLKEIIDLEETCPFEEEVIAYPTITTIQNSRKITNTEYYKITDVSDLPKLERGSQNVRILYTSRSTDWFSFPSIGKPYENLLASIEHQGFKIGIGVATGLDTVFIRKDFQSCIEKDLLLPILLSKDIINNELNWSGNYILNPFDETGKLIDLNKYPGARKYFESKKELLEKRHIARKNPRFWYKTIDKIHPKLKSLNKIILPDISGNTHLFIDKGNFYPHHNLYYIISSDYSKLEILAAILASDFVKNQLMEVGTKMNGGYPRWQSQNLKKLRIPLIDAIPNETCSNLRYAYNLKDYDWINKLISEKTICDYRIEAGQMKLF